MSALAVLGVGLLGGIGAVARFLLDGAAARRFAGAFPVGTLLVNVSGALLLGVVVGASLGTDAERIAGTGLLGAYTTFSTWSFESHRLAENGRPVLGAVNFALSLALGVAAAWLGRELGGLL